MPDGWQSVHLDEIDPIAVVDGKLLWRPVRRTLDVGAFGINAYVAPNIGDDVVEEHTERSLGHEEVYVVLAGRATFTLGDETLDAPAGTIVFIRDPEVRRHARAEEPGTSVLAVGGPRDAAYEPSPWEDYFAAERHRTAGDYESYVAELEDALAASPRPPGDALQPRVRRGARRSLRRCDRARDASARAEARVERRDREGRGLRGTARPARLAALAVYDGVTR